MIGKFSPFIVQAAVLATAGSLSFVRSTNAATEIANEVDWLVFF